MANKEIINSLRGLIGKYNLTDEEWQTVEKTIKLLNNSDSDCISRKSAEMCLTANITNMTIEEYISMVGDRIKGLSSIQPKPKTDVLDKIRAEIEQEYLAEGHLSDYWDGIDKCLEIIDKYKAESEEQRMSNQMEFPETFEKFAKEYGFKDNKEVYTNGSDLIQIFRVKQWLEHDNKIRKIETDTAYECGKHANKWIPISERLPEEFQRVLVTIVNYQGDKIVRVAEYHSRKGAFQVKENREWWEVGEKGLLAWMPLPEPYTAESEEV